MVSELLNPPAKSHFQRGLEAFRVKFVYAAQLSCEVPWKRKLLLGRGNIVWEEVHQYRIPEEVESHLDMVCY